MEYPAKNPDCDSEKCFQILRLMLDDQASKEQRDYFNNHIEKCIYCLEEYNLGAEIKELLRKKAHRQEVPANLAEAIRSVVLPTT